MPSCSAARMLTSWRANTPVTACSTPGRSATSRLNRYSADVSSIARMHRPAERAERAVRALAQVDRGVDHVAEHGARGRQAAGAAAVEHQRPDGTTLDEHRVVALADARQRVVERDHRRVHAHADLAGGLVLLGDREQLHDVAEPLRHGDVGGGDAADALVVHVAGDDLRRRRRWRR